MPFRRTLLPETAIRKRWALLVGVDRYVDPALGALAHCSNDVLALEHELEALGYSVVALHDRAAEEHRLPMRANIEAELATLSQAVQTDDLLWVHFSGYVARAEGQPALITRETRLALMARTSLPLAQMCKALRAGKNRRVFLTLDTSPLEGGAADGRLLQDLQKVADGLGFMAGSTVEQTDPTWRERSRGPLSFYLAEGLASEDAPGHKGFVTLDDLRGYVAKALRAWNAQHNGRIPDPVGHAAGLGGLVLAEGAQAIPAPGVRRDAGLPREYTLSADGRGAFRTLTEAVASVSPESTLVLKAGTYRLSQPVVINKPLTVRGEGMEQTSIACEGEGFVLQLDGPGPFRLSQLSLQHTGLRWGHAMQVTGGDLDLRQCRFTGGKRDSAGQRGGDGLALGGHTRGKVAACEMTGNEAQGASVAQEAHVDLVACRSQGNLGHGIGYLGEATGTARQNICASNGRHGIAVTDQAHPTLEGNRCQGNAQGGICYAGASYGAARQNTCNGNDGSGIVVEQRANPTLDGNTCQSNKASGLKYGGMASGSASENMCGANFQDGIWIGERAEPTLEKNHALRNKRNGLAYSGNAAGTARQNTCAGNEANGIGVGEDAQPMLIGNTCQANKVTGLAYFDGAAGTARQNRCINNTCDGLYVGGHAQPSVEDNGCLGNENSGILVGDEAEPTLEMNTCEHNAWSGIVYVSVAGGVARLNDCRDNGNYGISVQQHARPKLEENHCERNTWSGIAYHENGSGTAIHNVCADNERNGIYLEDHAYPLMRDNTCQGNGADGISFRGEAQGDARGNICHDNKGDGIFVASSTHPVVLDNHCNLNQGQDLRDLRLLHKL